MNELKAATWVSDASELCYLCGRYVRLWKIHLPFGMPDLKICPECLPKFKQFLNSIKETTK